MGYLAHLLLILILLNLLEKAFPEQVAGKWQAKIQQIIPSYGKDLAKDPALLDQFRTETSRTLGLVYTPKGTQALPAPTDAAAIAALNETSHEVTIPVAR